MRSGVVPGCAALSVAMLLCSAPGNAQPTELRYDLWLDGAVTLGAVAALSSSQAMVGELAPESCRWCNANRLDQGARDLLRWSNPRAADRLSTAGVYAVAPSAVLGSLLVASWSDARVSNLPVDLLLTAEASMLAMLACQGTKLAVARRRPWVHAIDGEARQLHPEDNLSFFSGHTTLAFSLAASAGTIATMRKYPSADWVWFSGMTVAATIGYLRIAGDKHYLTDVLAGAVVGSAVGVAVPWLFHGPLQGIRLAPAPGGLSASGVF